VNLPITPENITDWFPSPHVENPLAGDSWWQIQSIGLLIALQYLRLLPDDANRQQAFIELRRSVDTALLSLPAPHDEEVQRRRAQSLAPWCPSPFDVVEVMLDLADLRPGDRLLDLGSGDGRIVFAAAKRDVWAHGIEIDARFVAEATERASEDPRYEAASFTQGRIEDADWGEPTVITCYLVSTAMAVLEPRFRLLPPGTRIVSHAFPIPGWHPHRVVSHLGVPIFLWIVPAAPA
jgi:SAM-dependent methyltransferase